MQQVIEQDNIESTTINDAIEHNQDFQSHGTSTATDADNGSLLSSSTDVTYTNRR
jgi:hypothetical protein